jgi:hypothetical protein
MRADAVEGQVLDRLAALDLNVQRPRCRSTARVLVLPGREKRS